MKFEVLVKLSLVCCHHLYKHTVCACYSILSKIELSDTKVRLRGCCEFKQEKNFNIINILFPQVWQMEPAKTNPHYRDIKEKNIEHEVKILKCVVRFVQNTKRFKKEKFGY